MAIIAIDDVDYVVYGSDVEDAPPSPPDPVGVVSAATYLNAKLGAGLWSAVTTTADDRVRALVTAQRGLDSLRWKGAKTVPTQPLAWPRTGVTLSDGTVVDSTVYPLTIVYAEYELAFLLLTNPTLLVDIGSGGDGNIKRIKAGSAEVEFFSSTKLTVLPAGVLSLVWDYLSSASRSSSVALSFGTGLPSSFDIPGAFDISGPRTPLDQG